MGGRSFAVASIDYGQPLLYSARRGVGGSTVPGAYPSEPLCKLKTSREVIKTLQERGIRGFRRTTVRSSSPGVHEAAADGGHRRRDLAVRGPRRAPRRSRRRHVPLDRGHTALPFGHRGRSPARPRRAFRARLGERLGRARRRSPALPARASFGDARSCASSGRSAAPTRTGSSTPSSAAPRSARWRGSTTRSTTSAAAGPSGARRRRCSCRPTPSGD